MSSLRTPETKLKYQEYLGAPVVGGCDLCRKPALQSFTYWKITENRFPYDLIAETHHMLLPIRHVTEEQFTPEEITELLMIKRSTVAEEYEWIIEASPKKKSIPSHFHLHLIVGKTS